MASRSRRKHATPAAMSAQREAMRVLYRGEPVSREELAAIERRLAVPRQTPQRELALEAGPAK